MVVEMIICNTNLFRVLGRRVPCFINICISKFPQVVGYIYGWKDRHSTETTSRVEEFQHITVLSGITCDQYSDLVKSMPEHNGDQTRYVSDSVLFEGL